MLRRLIRPFRTAYWAGRAMWWALCLRLSGLPQATVATEVRLRLEKHGMVGPPKPERTGAPGFLLKKGPKDIHQGPPHLCLSKADMDEYWRLWSAVVLAHDGKVSEFQGRRVLRVSTRVVAWHEVRGRPWPCGKCGPCRAVTAFDKAHAEAFS